jgi:hypothetical protein
MPTTCLLAPVHVGLVDVGLREDAVQQVQGVQITGVQPEDNRRLSILNDLRWAAVQPVGQQVLLLREQVLLGRDDGGGVVEVDLGSGLDVAEDVLPYGRRRRGWLRRICSTQSGARLGDDFEAHR